MKHFFLALAGYFVARAAHTAYRNARNQSYLDWVESLPTTVKK